MRVLIGCECSGVIRDAFRAVGCKAFSCDLKPSADTTYHLQCDVFEAIKRGPWHLGIFHPECTFLSNSGVLRLYKDGKKANGRDEKRWENMRRAADFFSRILASPIPRICVENPIMHGHGRDLIGVRHAQVIQPWMFGDDASKATCLWLKNLPPPWCPQT